MRPNPETQKLISEGGALARLVNSPDWVEAKKYLNDMFVQLDSWSTLPEGMTETAKVKEMKARQAAISLVQQWVNTLEGKAEQGMATGKAFIDRNNTTENIFSYFPERSRPNQII